jgi:drug/metabolite transporter (DMT)-like permease
MRRASLIRLGALALTWGSGFMWAKIALRGLGPTQVVLGQLVVGAAVLAALVTAGRQRWPRGRSTWLHLGVMAVIGTVAPYLLFTWGQQRIPSGLAGVLSAATPLFTLLLAVGARLEQLSPARAAGLAVGFAGVVVIGGPWRGGAGAAVSGVAACLAAAVCYAAFYVYARRHLAGHGDPPLALAAGQLAIGAGLLALAAPLVARQPVALSAAVVASVLLLGVLCTAGAYALNYRLIQDEGATAASTVTYLIPVVALALGAAVLGEPVTWRVAAGAAVVLAGVAISQRTARLA